MIRESLSSTLQVLGHAATVPVGILPHDREAVAGLGRSDHDRATTFWLVGSGRLVGHVQDLHRFVPVREPLVTLEVLLRQHDEPEVMDVQRGAPPFGGMLVVHPVDLREPLVDAQDRDVVGCGEAELGLLGHVRRKEDDLPVVTFQHVVQRFGVARAVERVTLPSEEVGRLVVGEVARLNEHRAELGREVGPIALDQRHLRERSAHQHEELFALVLCEELQPGGEVTVELGSPPGVPQVVDLLVGVLAVRDHRPELSPADLFAHEHRNSASGAAHELRHPQRVENVDVGRIGLVPLLDRRVGVGVRGTACDEDRLHIQQGGRARRRQGHRQIVGTGVVKEQDCGVFHSHLPESRKPDALCILTY